MNDPNATPYERNHARREAMKHSPHWHDIERRREGEALASTGAIKRQRRITRATTPTPRSSPACRGSRT